MVAIGRENVQLHLFSLQNSSMGELCVTGIQDPGS